MKNTKKCPRCNEAKSTDLFYIQNKTSGKLGSWCKSCTKDFAKQRKIRIRTDILNHYGNQCIKCGYNKCLGALEFHHKDSTQKDPNYDKFRQLTFNNKLKAELDKCDLLCANCHREAHHLTSA